MFLLQFFFFIFSSYLSYLFLFIFFFFVYKDPFSFISPCDTKNIRMLKTRMKNFLTKYIFFDVYKHVFLVYKNGKKIKEPKKENEDFSIHKKKTNTRRHYSVPNLHLFYFFFFFFCFFVLLRMKSSPFNFFLYFYTLLHSTLALFYIIWKQKTNKKKKNRKSVFVESLEEENYQTNNNSNKQKMFSSNFHLSLAFILKW